MTTLVLSFSIGSSSFSADMKDKYKIMDEFEFS